MGQLYCAALNGEEERSQLLSFSSSSPNNCCFRCRRAAFLIARRSAAVASFSAWRSRRVRGSADCGMCLIFGRSGPTFRSLGFAYGSIKEFSRSYFNHEWTRINTNSDNDEIRMTNGQAGDAISICHSGFVINSLFDIRASAFHNSSSLVVSE